MTGRKDNPEDEHNHDGIAADYGDAIDDKTREEMLDPDGWIDPSFDPFNPDGHPVEPATHEPVVEMPSWAQELRKYVNHDDEGVPTVSPMVFTTDPREADLTAEQQNVLTRWRAEMMRAVFEPDGYTRDYDAEIDQIRFEDRISGIDFSEFLFRYYPKSNTKSDFNDSTTVHIADKGITVAVGAFRREVIKKQAEQLADDALMVMTGNETVRQSVWDDDILELDTVTESIENGELDVRDTSNAVVKQGAFQLARRGHNVGVIAVYKGGKSALMDHFAMCSLSGAKLFGEIDVEQVPDFVTTVSHDDGTTTEETRPGKLLYIDPERGVDDAKMELGRAFAWMTDYEGNAVPTDEAAEIRKRLVFYNAAEHSINIAAPDDQKHLIEFCNHHGVTRVILDSAMMISGKTDTLVDTEVDMLFKSWEKIKSKTQIQETYWVLHTSHTEQGRAYGSQRWMARLQSIWLLQREKENESANKPQYHFTVTLGRGGTRYPKREWGLDNDTMRPYFIGALSTEDMNEMMGTPMPETGDPTGTAANNTNESHANTDSSSSGEDEAFHALQRDVVQKILTEELVSQGETALDDGTLLYGGIKKTEIHDLVQSRWDAVAGRFVGPAPKGTRLAARINETLTAKTALTTSVYAEERKGRSTLVYLTLDGYDEANTGT